MKEETGVGSEPSSPTAPRLGVTVAASRQLTLDSIVAIAQAAEALGYESIWVPETWGPTLFPCWRY
jgi:alkanesulfonate monooxygenase SsuD/methylene tetrahydromethanopterin reductase-like flavin-dependent oxidoreductase (luciferase family)